MNVFQNKIESEEAASSYDKSKSRNLSVVSREENDEFTVNMRTNELTDSYLNILQSIGEDPNREGLLKTPQRAAKAILFFTKGYEETVNGLIDYSF